MSSLDGHGAGGAGTVHPDQPSVGRGIDIPGCDVHDYWGDIQHHEGGC